jgi:hypothetical protein
MSDSFRRGLGARLRFTQLACDLLAGVTVIQLLLRLSGRLDSVQTLLLGGLGLALLWTLLNDAPQMSARLFFEPPKGCMAKTLASARCARSGYDWLFYVIGLGHMPDEARGAKF